MKSLTDLLAALLVDTGRICSVETDRDLAYAKQRSQHEGISFLTITLPNFCDDFERCLDKGRVASTDFAGWRKTGCLPKFLSGFTRLVFDAEGVVRHDVSINAVFSIRQITRFFKKVRIPCTSAREAACFKKYRDLEASFQEGPLNVDANRLHHFARVCSTLWSGVFQSSWVDFDPHGLVPRHGPGATAERISGNAKFVIRTWTERLEPYFPIVENGFASLNHVVDTDDLNDIDIHSPQEELPVRVISVPKTLKGPRIIAIEPVCMQYTQQALLKYIVASLKRSKYTKHVIRFDDQQPNQQMALRASVSGSHATIDLSDASDRVRLDMVQIMLESCPDILGAILACRSTRAQLPDGEIIHLKKFASMGSALCFPIEAMYFYSVIVHSLLWERGIDTPRTSDILSISRGRYVYGDDIIVPTNETDSVIAGLTLFGCKVNTNKTFKGLYFKESCGMDAFKGERVTPVYLRELPPRNARDTARLLSWVATSNQLYTEGMWYTSSLLKKCVEQQLGNLPVVHENSPGLGWVSYQGIPNTYAMCIHTHRPLVNTYKVKTIRKKDTLDGYHALLKYFLNAREGTGLPSSTSKEHLQSSVRMSTVSRKRTWVPA